MNDTLDRLVRKANSLVIDNRHRLPFGNKIFDEISEWYVAGHNLDQGFYAMEHNFLRHRRYSTFDVLGENAHTVEESDRYVNAYMTTIDKIAEFNKRHFIPAKKVAQPITISVKPSAICAVTEDGKETLPQTPLSDRLEKILSYAKERGVNVTLDMEDHNWTDTSLEVAKEMWKKGYDTLGIVLQSRLNRTQKDIAELFGPGVEYGIDKKKMRVRACIGIYNEPAEIATTSRSVAKNRLVKDVEALFDAGIYVEIATHDKNTVRQIVEEVIMPRMRAGQITTKDFEFQFLKGVHNGEALERELNAHYMQHTNDKFQFRYYMPAEINRGDGTPYMERRLKANPSIVLAGGINAVQHMMSAGMKRITQSRPWHD